jgi:hypothetical protein
MLAHRQEMDSTQQDNDGRTKGGDQDHHTIGTSFIFYACGDPSSHASSLQQPLTMSDTTTRYHYQERNTTIPQNSMGQQTSPREMGRRGMGSIIGTDAHARTQGAGGPREKGEKARALLVE